MAHLQRRQQQCRIAPSNPKHAQRPAHLQDQTQLNPVGGLVALCGWLALTGRGSTAPGAPARNAGTSVASSRFPQATRTTRASSSGRSSTPSPDCEGGFRITPFGEDSNMTVLQIFFNSLRSRTIVRAIWMPVLIGILLIGACIPSKHATAPAKPPQTMQPQAKSSSKAIIRQHAYSAGGKILQSRKCLRTRTSIQMR